MTKKSNKGFTLLELMISMTLIGIIMLIVFGAMRLGYRSIEKVERTTEFLERVRTSLNVIESQLQSQIPLTYEEEGEKRLYFTGQKGFIQFATNYSIWNGSMGYVRTVYNVEQDARGRLALYVTENTISMSETRKTLLLNDLEGVSFKYYYKDPTMEQGEWRDEWIEKSFLPEFVNLNIWDSSRKLFIDLLIKIKNTELPEYSVEETRRDTVRQTPERGKALPGRGRGAQN